MKRFLIVCCCLVLFLGTGALVLAQSRDDSTHAGRRQVGRDGGGHGIGRDQATPVPEPATLLTLGIGAAGAYAARKKLKKD